MSAGIYSNDRMFSARERTWHGKEIFRDVVTWEEAFELSGIKQPKLEPVYANVNGLLTEVTDRRAVTVTGQDQPLAIVSNRYHLMDPRKAFDILDTIVQDGTAVYETAGTLKDQRIMWGLLKLNESYRVVRGDEIQPYIFVTDFRDGTGAAKFGSIQTRVVCANTHSQAMGERGLTSIRHTKGINERVEEAARILGLIRQQTESTVAQYQMLADARPTRDEARDFIMSLLPVPERPDDPEKLGSWEVTRANVSRDRAKVGSLYMGAGKGAALAGDSYWGLFNAVTEFVDHFRQPTAAADTRLYSKTLGVGADLKAKAFDMALAGAKAAGATPYAF